MAQVDFPYGKKRNWELDTADADIGLKSVSDSLVLKHSTCQSRERWLHNTFHKFTSKARGAKAHEPPPPHTIMSRGKCDLIVGPHLFRQTTFYQVHYMQPPSTVPTYQMSSTAYTPYSSSSTQQPSTAPASSTIPAPTTAAPGSSDAQDLSQLRLTLGGGLEYTISSDLVARIHHEASVNPIFAAKFRLAVEPNATPEQIRNFAFALPHLPGVKVTGASSSLTLSTEQQVHLPPVREWDLVIEFHETPNERWLMPRGTLASCSRLVSRDGSGLSEVTLTLRFPLPEPKSTNPEGTNSSDKSSPESNPPLAVKFTLRRTSNAVYDLILSWIGGDDKNKDNAATLAKMQPKRQKVYLSHCVPPGALLTQLQAAQTSGYTMKLLKQGPSNPPRPRRKAAPKTKPKSTPQETPVSSGTPTVPVTDLSLPAVQTSKPAKTPREPKDPKRRRYQSAAKPTPVIRCTVCFKTDVPLMKGGRFCRECVDAGKANDAIPQLPQKSSLPSYTPTPYSFAAPTSSAVIPVTVTQPIAQPQPPPNTPTATSAVASGSATPPAAPVLSPISQSSITPSRDTSTPLPTTGTVAENTISNPQSPSAPGTT